MGTKESGYSSVPILLSIGSGPFTEHAERCSVDAVTPSKARRKHRERMDNRRESQPERSSLRSSHLLRCFMAWEAFFEARTQLESRRLEDRFRQENGTIESSHSSVPILLSIGLRQHSPLTLLHGLGGLLRAGNTGLELGGKQGREREAVPPRLPSGRAAGLDLVRLRGVFREPDGTTASGWNDAEVSLSDFCTLPPFPLLGPPRGEEEEEEEPARVPEDGQRMKGAFGARFRLPCLVGSAAGARRWSNFLQPAPHPNLFSGQVGTKHRDHRSSYEFSFRQATTKGCCEVIGAESISRTSRFFLRVGNQTLSDRRSDRTAKF